MLSGLNGVISEIAVCLAGEEYNTEAEDVSTVLLEDQDVLDLQAKLLNVLMWRVQHGVDGQNGQRAVYHVLVV